MVISRKRKLPPDVSRRTDSARDPDRPRRGFHRPRPVDRRAARASTGTACYMRCSRRDAERASAAVIGRRRNDRRLIPDNVGVVMMPSRLIGVGQSVAGAECENGRERDDGSHQHGLCPLSSQALSIENAAGSLSGKPSLPHPRVGRFNISGQFWQIEQGTGVTVFLQFLPQRDQALRVARQRQRRLFIFLAAIP